ncbi:MAG: glycosyltransferase [Hyphomicrobiales bacterium]
MLTSVIMPAYNAERFIVVAIGSLLQEREKIALDIIVIDDGSTDGTRAIVERLALSNAEIRLLQNPRKGIAAARNTGLTNLRESCEFVAFMDADDASVAGRLARQRTLLCEDLSIDMLYGRVEMFTEFDDSLLRPREGSRTKIIRGPYLQSAMYRPHVFDKVGRFDESYRQGCDTDYLLRCLDSGFKLVLDDEVAAYYRRHNSNVTLNTAEVQREFMRATLKWAARNKLKRGEDLPELYKQIFLRRDKLEKGFAE